jgi:site-specific DNA-cytosine methylase
MPQKGNGQKHGKAKGKKTINKHLKENTNQIHSPKKVSHVVTRRILADSCNGIRVGTDFSGWDTPIMSLHKLSIKHLHVFSCEKESQLRSLIRQNSKPLKIYKDIVSRDASTSLPCDLYVAGPPCQPWSSAGKNEGLEDEQGRGTMLWFSLAYVGMERPKVVVIENVKGLLQKHRHTFDMFLTNFKNKGYTVFWELMNTLEHGLPQSRPRVYVVGFRSDLNVQSFEFPNPFKGCVPLSRILRPPDFAPEFKPRKKTHARRRIHEAIKSLKSRDIDVNIPAFVDTAASKKFAHFTVGHCPCLTRSRGSQGGYYVTTLKRKLTLEDWQSKCAHAPQMHAVEVSRRCDA